MKTFAYILKTILFGTLFLPLPYWAAKAFDLDVLAFIITFDFVLLLFILAGNDRLKGRKFKQEEIKFPFPFHDSDYK